MAASDFGTAIYTNCAPGDGLEPVGGMQFQSRSAGVDREVLGIIRRHLIYEPPVRLIQERQPVDAFRRRSLTCTTASSPRPRVSTSGARRSAPGKGTT